MEELYKTGTLDLVNKQGFSTVIPLKGQTVTDDDFQKQVEEDSRRVKKNAEKLLPGKGEVPSDAVDYMVKVQLARAQTMENPWYRLISMISAFSTEPITKFWKKQEDVERGMALANETTGGVYSAIDAAVTGQGSKLLKSQLLDSKSEKEVSEYVQNRRDFLASPEVYGKLFLTPVIFGHISEAKELIQNHCHVHIDIESFIQSEHATYFARLISLRMNTSRFLSGRFYHLSGNYGRLLTQTNRLLEYFKCRLQRHPSGHAMTRYFPNQISQHQLALNPPLRLSKESRRDFGKLRPQTRHAYFDKLGEL